MRDYELEDEIGRIINLMWDDYPRSQEKKELIFNRISKATEIVLGRDFYEYNI